MATIMEFHLHLTTHQRIVDIAQAQHEAILHTMIHIIMIHIMEVMLKYHI